MKEWGVRKRRVETFQQQWRAEAALNEDMYELRWEIKGLPTNVEITMPSTARAIVDEATDHNDFDPRWLKFQVPTYGLTEKAAEKAARIRAFIIGWLYEQVVTGNDVSPVRDFIKNLHLFGKAVYKTVAVLDEWPELEVAAGATEDEAREAREQLTAERRYATPIAWRSVSPMALYEDPAVGVKCWAIECYPKSAIEVIEQYGEYLDESTLAANSGDDDGTLEVWDCYQVGVKDGVPGLFHQIIVYCGVDPDTADDNYQSVGDSEFMAYHPFPYTVRFSGFGRQSSGKYEEKARGILSGAISLLQAEARRLSQTDAIVSALAWPTLFVTGPRSRFHVEYGPNVVNYVPSGVTATTITPQLPVGPLQTSLAVLQSGIERATFGSVIRGDKPPQVTSAAQLSILSGQARLRFMSIKIGHEAALTDVITKAATIARDVIDEDLTVWQVDDTDETKPADLVLKQGDIPDRFVCKVTIKTDPADERERDLQMAVFLFEKGAIDWEEMAERVGVTDVSAMRRRMIRDKILLNSPAVLQALGEQYILESGYDIESLTLEKTMRDMLILRTQQQMQSQIMAPPAGPAGSPEKTAGMNPTVLGGAPTNPTAPMAQMNAEASVPGGTSVTG